MTEISGSGSGVLPKCGVGKISTRGGGGKLPFPAVLHSASVETGHGKCLEAAGRGRQVPS
ncbi:hypothetical protein BRCON_2340 [Candidatus Sumerlaea chitinivorans]|uniref:Uncharacterized protein n=1 Tax=Sumerlaea chitinivorans TaxID=2250252 RepID=A0A2Z4Y799_SUMC1|nr:hypothetical protein BRCON_2340 [Candidatus Sumerlaea chitinivorans]